MWKARAAGECFLHFSGTFKCARARCKTCPFICNVEKLLRPKRSIKITDHFTCTSANVIYLLALFAKSNISAKQVDDKATDSENIFATLSKTTKTYLNRSLDTLICRIIPSNICQSAASPYTKEAQKATKH